MSVPVFSDRSAPQGHLAKGGHGVEFYAYDAQIVARIADFVTPAFEANEAVVIIATREHRTGLVDELKARGIDLARARTAGQYTELDAAITVSKILTGNTPDQQRFADVVGGAIAKAQERGPFTHVRAYGEMVALLWLAGRPQDALELERMWNGLGASGSFTLLCGYPVAAFQATQAAEIAEVGRVHSQIAPIRPLLRSSLT